VKPSVSSQTSANYIPDTGKHGTAEFQLPDARQAPALWLLMRCPKCMEEAAVDVYRGVPIHKGCAKVAVAPWPVLEPVVVRAWVNQQPALCIFREFVDEQQFERRHRAVL
jgi:hypothetical protein